MLKQNPECRFEFYLRLGYFYLTVDNEKSVAVLTRALAENKKSPLGWIGLGKAYYYMANYDKSKTALNQANVYDPNNPEIWAYLALNLLKSKTDINMVNQCLKELFKLDIKEEKDRLI